VREQTNRRAAFRAAVVGVLLALTASVGLVLPTSAAAGSGGVTTTGSTHASIAPTVSQAGPSAARMSHATYARAAAVDRSTGGHGDAVGATTLLVLALLALMAAVAPSWRRRTSLAGTGTGPRAPPTPAFC
jgi:hypothetical protein